MSVFLVFGLIDKLFLTNRDLLNVPGYFWINTLRQTHTELLLEIMRGQVYPPSFNNVKQDKIYKTIVLYIPERKETDGKIPTIAIVLCLYGVSSLQCRKGDPKHSGPTELKQS